MTTLTSNKIMNTYKVLSINEATIVIEFTIAGEKVTETLDVRYVPTDSAAALDAFCTNYIENYQKGASIVQEQTAVSADVQALIGKPQEIVA